MIIKMETRKVMMAAAASLSLFLIAATSLPIYAQMTTNTPEVRKTTTASPAPITITTPPSNTFDSIKHGIRIHYPDGWSVRENNETTTTIAPKQRLPTFELIAVTICPPSEVESHWLLQVLDPATTSEQAREEAKSNLCMVVPDAFNLSYQRDLNKSESTYLNGKQNITIDDYYSYIKEQIETNTVYMNAKINNVTDAVIKVINPNTNQTIRELPAKIIESYAFNTLTNEYQTLLALITVDGVTNTGYKFSEISTEDNRIVKDMQSNRQLIQGFEILEG